jgi:Flp pilus assembly pilin Flp
MKILKRLWNDEAGVIMSAETVMLGTMGVLAMTAGVGTMATAVNGELGELSKAFRSFDQSFSTPGFQTSFGSSTGGAGRSSGFSGGTSAGLSGTMGSGYSQPSAAASQAQLDIQLMQRQTDNNVFSGQVIQQLSAAQIQQIQQYSELRRESVCAGAEL